MKTYSLVSCSALVLTAGVAHASVLPQVAGEMKHAMIGFDGAASTAHVDDLPGEPATDPVVLVSYPGDDAYTAGGVLDGTYYSARFGWLSEGFISLPVGGAIWIEQLSTTPGLNIYEGGMRTMRENHTYAPLFGTEGSPDIWKWPGTMVHNWYSADAPGSYEASYRVYIGDDATGAALTGFGSADDSFSFIALPAPGAPVVALAGLALATRRRR